MQVSQPQGVNMRELTLPPFACHFDDMANREMSPT